jgi:hypothetical protein
VDGSNIEILIKDSESPNRCRVEVHSGVILVLQEECHSRLGLG